MDSTASNIQLLKSALYAVAMFLDPIMDYIGIKTDVLGIYAFLLTFDFITGVIKAWRVNQIRLKSSLAISGLVSKLIMIMVPIVLGLLIRVLGREGTGLIDAIIGILCLAETYSILGNIYSIRTRKLQEEWDAVSTIIYSIKRRIRKAIQAGLED
jgi:toxin secretion/phage lysis holin